MRPLEVRILVCASRPIRCSPSPFFSYRDEAVRSALARLVWSLLRDPSVLRHKACKLVSSLLTSVSYRHPQTSEGEADAGHGKFLERYARETRILILTKNFSARALLHFSTARPTSDVS